MKKLYFILVILISPWLAFAQQPQGESFTLEQCIQYALDNSISAKNAQLDQQIAAARVKETVGLGLPQVTGAVSLQHNEKLRRFFGTYSDNPQGFSFFPTGIAGAKDGDILAAQSPFQLKNGGDAGITINQLLFNGSYVVGLQASSAYKDLASKQAIQTSEQIIQGVTKAYYSVLINRERAELFNTNIARVDTLLRNAKALNANGFAENIDVDRIQVTLNNLTTERDKFLNYNELSLQLLKFQMNYPMETNITVQGSIEEIIVDQNLASYKEGWDYKTRSDYQILAANHKLQSLNVRNQYAGAMPSLVAFANLGYSTQSADISGLFKTNSGVKDQGGLGPDKWYGYSLIGVSLNWNLFTGMSRSYKIQQEKLSLQKIENGFRNLKSGIELETQTTGITFENALKTLTAQKQNMDLASNVARVTKIKYEQGVGSNLEVIDAEGSLKESQTNYYGALFDAVIAKVDLDKAYGRLKAPVTENK